ncbi:hybrid sensor histidine kinase/response regulator transcription factor [Zooshikella ganghwensis]|uniref:hybrid sensor histidine kinase/response regulator transcription factor n=1 Tax=Zooshikella ganghwensis TaxID=202772 RepID=UPI0004251DFB|nr:hybrid sensor histidine kinase/response regulator transcription factor [Zooshikella ganghwensis]
MCYFQIVVVLLLFSLKSLAFSQHINFKNLNVSEGLSQNTINDIVQDRQGFIWIATNDGLNRFDGFDVKIYRNDKENPLSISNNVIKTLLVDKDGKLWIGTLGGLNKYNPVSDSFEYFINEQNNPESNKVFSLSEGRDGIIWVGTKSNFLYSFNSKTKSYKLHHLPGNNTKEIISQVLEDELGRLWVGTYNGLYNLNKDFSLRKYYQFYYGESNNKLSKIINSLLSVDGRNIFVGTSDGLYLLDTKEGIYKSFFSENNGLSSNRIEALFKVDAERILVGTSQGLNLFNRKNSGFISYSQSNDVKQALNDSYITSIFQDGTGMLWVGTFEGGVNLININSLEFGLYNSDIDKKECLSNNSIYNIIKSSKGDVWVSAYDGGFHKISLSEGKCVWFSHDHSDDKSISSNKIAPTGLFEDSKGDIWIGTLGKGLNRLPKGSNNFIRYLPDKNNKDAISSGAVRSIVEDNKGNLWMGTDGGGLTRYDYKTDTFSNYLYKKDTPNSISSPYVFDIEINDNELWIGTENGGLDYYDIETNTFKNFGNSYGIKSAIFSIKDDGEGNLWLGTAGSGLIKFNKSNQQAKYYTVDDGLPNNTIYKILIDKKGLLWLATNYGIARFDPNTEKSINYTVDDGLQGNEFNVGGFYDKKNNELLFVGSNGFNIFNPDLITRDNHKPNTVITNFLLFNKPANHLFQKSIKLLNKIELDYHQNIFSFEFAGLHYASPKRNQYQYKLEGFDADWLHTGAKRRIATYTNLDPGVYQFKVKSSNHHGVWGEEKQVQVVIKPPLWLTWWAKMIYTLLIIVIPFSIYGYRTRSLRRHARLLEVTVETRTHELFNEKRRVEKLLNNKTREFDNISHEFRTPLAIILGRAESGLSNTVKDKDRNNYQIIHKVANRLAVIVDDVIEMARTNKIGQATAQKVISISLLVQDICENMREYATLKNQHFDVSIEPKIFQVCQAKAIEKLVNNLVSNAIKYTPNDGEIEVILKRHDENHYSLLVKDNGIGIASKDKEHIFQRFFRIDNEYVYQVQGTGIGLSLVKDVVEAHNGCIDVHSVLNEGSTFCILMPCSTKSIDVTPYEVNRQYIDVIMESIDTPKESDHGMCIEEKIEEEVTGDCVTEKPLLLVVEDNKDMRDLLKDQLEKEYQLIIAEDGVVALEIAQNAIPHLVISDINMPNMNGYQLLNRLKNSNATSHVPVILLTAKTDAASRLAGFRYQADGYVAKPYEHEELLAIIQAQLSNKKRIKEYIKASLETNTTLEEGTVDEYTNKVIVNCVSYIEQHYQDDSLSVKQLTEVACLSERQLLRKFQDNIGMSPIEFINDFRLIKGQLLLKQGLRVSEVAFQVGYSSASYFSRQYKKKYGISPSQALKSKSCTAV